MRKSMREFSKESVSRPPYPAALPEKLEPLHYYIAGSGHVIMSVVKKNIIGAQTDEYDDYEIGLPVKYVLEKGYEMKDGYCIVDVEHSLDFGAIVGEEYDEF